MSETASTSKKALLFIPDISGYSNFVNETEADHAIHIVQELLETIIDSDSLGLEVSEIEGDAIFFYRPGAPPDLAILLEQVRRMFVNFHAQLKRYETHRICDCGACSTATNLTLKFITHYGSFSEANIKGRKSLFGNDVILVHRLMKNGIDSNEYALFTHQVLDQSTTSIQLADISWSGVESGEEVYESGPVQYDYISLTPLVSEVPEPQKDNFELKGKMMEMLSSKGEIEAPIDLVFDVVADLSFRDQWMINIKGSDQVNNKITQNGSSHRCIIKDDKSDPFFISHGFKREKGIISFEETEIKKGQFVKFELKELPNNRTEIQYLFKMKNNPVLKLIFSLFLKRKFIKGMQKNFEALNGYVKELLNEG
ncbi:MAG: DUF2652 domain-containing protein, partial [Bacteroidia bacterium]|nr:DUF2652 domain-containing protein [Bacteroidia bacterium]